MPTSTAAELKPDFTERHVEFIVDDDDPVSRDLVEITQTGHRTTGQVHVGPRYPQRHRNLGQCSFRYIGLRSVPLEPGTEPGGEQFDHHPPGIVPLPHIFLTGIAETDHEPAVTRHT